MSGDLKIEKKPFLRHGVVKALARFRMRRRLIMQRRVITFMKETLFLAIVVSAFTQYLFVLAFQAYADLDLHVLLEFWVLLFGGVLGFLAGICTFFVRVILRRWPLPVQLEGNISVDMLIEKVSTGDIILFSYPVRFDGFWGHAIDIFETLGLKLQGKVQWTHVGIVIEDEYGRKLLAEATTDETVAGHIGPGLCDLRERLSKSFDYDMIAWRRLEGFRVENHEKELTLKWIKQLSNNEDVCLGRYNLDLSRALGKIMYDFGWHATGLTLLSSGLPFEFDCAFFSGEVLAKLGILETKGETMLRILAIPHFSCERPESFYTLHAKDGFDWGPQILINL